MAAAFGAKEQRLHLLRDELLGTIELRMGRVYEGLTVAARDARAAGFVDRRMAKAAERVDTAYHLVRHLTEQRCASMVGEFRTACAGPSLAGVGASRGCGPDDIVALGDMKKTGLLDEQVSEDSDSTAASMEPVLVIGKAPYVEELTYCDDAENHSESEAEHAASGSLGMFVEQVDVVPTAVCNDGVCESRLTSYSGQAQKQNESCEAPNAKDKQFGEGWGDPQKLLDLQRCADEVNLLKEQLQCAEQALDKAAGEAIDNGYVHQHFIDEAVKEEKE